MITKKTKKRAPRTQPEIRKQAILNSAIMLSKRIGYKSITRDKVAKNIGVSSSLIAAYFPRMKLLKSTIIKTAIEREIVEIIAQVLTTNDSNFRIPTKLRKKAIRYLDQ